VAHREFQRTISLPPHPDISDHDDGVVGPAIEMARRRSLLRNRSGGIAVEFRARSGHPKTASGAGPVLRRLFEGICAAGGLALLAPAFMLIAVAIKLDDHGPVLYSQFRVGKGLRKFRLLKFRSMVPNPASRCLLTAPKDARVTRVGRFLRKYKLDELPQLVNVLKGEMQLVGVRPQVEKFVEFYPEEYEKLLQVPPGITDPASLRFRKEEELFHDGSIEEQYVESILPIKLALSLDYQRTRTFFSDLGIIFRTILNFKSRSTAPSGEGSGPSLPSPFKAASRNIS
jgi:lipopolysaccharide/colanic/teichoic acid biosynthesis glycosyltransferase